MICQTRTMARIYEKSDGDRQTLMQHPLHIKVKYRVVIHPMPAQYSQVIRG